MEFKKNKYGYLEIEYEDLSDLPFERFDHYLKRKERRKKLDKICQKSE